MAGEGAPNCAQIQKTPCREGLGVGECGSQGYSTLPPLPLGPAGPRLWRLSPSRAHVLCARAAGPPVPAGVKAAQARPEGVSQYDHFPRPTPRVLSTGRDARCRGWAGDEVRSQVAEVKRVPAQARPERLGRGRFNSSKEFPDQGARTMARATLGHWPRKEAEG